jgi:phosphohistidine phosphatase
MRLFLIRHAHALDHADDAQRPVSERGQQITRRVAEFFKANGRLQPAQVWHSPLQRAFETAADLVSQLDPEMALVETEGLLPSDDPAIMAERFRLYPTTHDVALVGHQPHLGALASLLVTGQAKPPLIHFKKNAVLALRRSDETFEATGLARWRIGWHYSPEFLPSSP